MIIGVSAEPIWDSCGPGNFLIEGLKHLAVRNPDWTFHVVARKNLAMSYARVADTSNVIFHIWDDTRLLRKIMSLDRLKHHEELIIKFGSKLPFRLWRKSFGDIKSIWNGLPKLDAIWVPHFDFNSRRWPIMYQNGFSAKNVLFTLHDLQVEFFPDDWESQQLINYRDGFIKLAKSCACIVTHAEFQKEGIRERLGIREDKISVVSLPPITDEKILFINNKNENIESVVRNNGFKQPYLLYPGSSGYTHKNHIRLLLAWSRLRKQLGDDCPLLVCTNKGHLWPAIKSLINALELQDIVFFTGTVDTKSLAILYYECTFVIVPTIYEGSGAGPMAEGILAGKHVICSKIPTFEEHLRAYDVENITFFDPLNVSDIATVIKNTWCNRTELSLRAKTTRNNFINKIPELWEDWGKVYSEGLRSAAVGSE